MNVLYEAYLILPLSLPTPSLALTAIERRYPAESKTGCTVQDSHNAMLPLNLPSHHLGTA